MIGPVQQSVRWVVVGVGVLAALGVAAVLLVTVVGGRPPGSAQEAADAYVAAFNSNDADELGEVLCAEQRDSAEILAISGEQGGTELTLLGPVRPSGQTATATATIVEDGLDTGERITLELRRDGAGWTVCTRP